MLPRPRKEREKDEVPMVVFWVRVPPRPRLVPMMERPLVAPNEVPILAAGTQVGVAPTPFDWRT